MMEHVDLVEMAKRAGTAAGLPRPPSGLPDGGKYELVRSPRKGGSKRVTLRYEHDGVISVLGWYVEQPDGTATQAPSSNGAGRKPKGGRPAPPPAAPEREPTAGEEVEPLILLTPAGGGAWRLSGYGVERAELIRALRLSLVHLVAQQAGVPIIDEVVAPGMAVVSGGGRSTNAARFAVPVQEKRGIINRL